MRALTSKAKARARRPLGVVALKLDALAAGLRAEQRRASLEAGARIDPTTAVLELAHFLNLSGDPDDIVIGANCSVAGVFLTLPQGGRITVGEHSFVGPFTNLFSAASITIGDYVLIAHQCEIHDNISHPIDALERRVEIDGILPTAGVWNHDFDIKARPLTIGDGAWIGAHACIIGGVSIGERAIVAAGSVVTKDVEPDTIVAGNPARVVRRLAEEH